MVIDYNDKTRYDEVTPDVVDKLRPFINEASEAIRKLEGQMRCLNLHPDHSVTHAYQVVEIVSLVLGKEATGEYEF